MNNEENKDSEFIKEVIKEKKKSKKTLLLKVLFILIIAAAAGFVAAVVFVFVSSTINTVIVDKSSDTSKVTIADDSTSNSSISVVNSSFSSQDSPADNTPDSDNSGNIESNTTEVIKEVIYDKELTIEEYEKLYDDLRQIADAAQNSIVTVTGITSQIDYFNESYENEQKSIGLIVAETSSSYYILTYSNIIEDATKIRVTFDDENNVAGVLQRSDPNTGFAVIRSEKNELSDFSISSVKIAAFANSSSAKKGDMIMVIGNPDGYSDYFAFGYITSTSNTISYYDNEYNILTTNVPNGSDGFGIILNLSGSVIGLSAPVMDNVSSTTIAAICISDISELIETLSNNEGRSYLGVIGSSVTEQISSETDMPTGVIVTSIAENSPAMMSGMMLYDIIVSVEEKSISSMQELCSMLREYKSGDVVKMSVMRQVADDYSNVELTVELGEI